MVLVTHYIGTGREQRFPGLVFGFKQIVGRFPAGPVLEIGTGRDSAYLKHRHRACAVSRDGNSGHFHQQIVVRAGELYDFGLVLPLVGAVRQHGIGGGGIIKRIIAGNLFLVEIIPGGKEHPVVVARSDAIDLRVVGVPQADNPVITVSERGKRSRAALNLFLW